ncbi:uncharacterized protein [Antedon mediterranea]|uniref:uncharacterized protein isoform X2 n=1 Tax=Antedon mediterranea TaxID=105859 RepID=UPI003AF6D966
MNSSSVYENEQILTNQKFELLYSELRNNNCLPKLKKISKTRKAKHDHAYKAGPPSTSEASTCGESFSSGLLRVDTRKAKCDHTFKDGHRSTSETSTCSERFSASGLQQVVTRKAKHDHPYKAGPPSTSEASTCGEKFSSGMQQVVTRKAKRDHAFKAGPQSTSETSTCSEMFSSGMQQVVTRKGRLVKDHAFDLRPPLASTCSEMFSSRPSPLHNVTSSDYGVTKNELTPWSDSSTFQSDTTSNAYDGSISESSTGQPVDSEYQDLRSPSVNGSLDTLEVSIIGYSGLEYDSEGDLFMMHKPRRHRCQLKSKKLNLKRLWAIAKYVKQPHKPSKSNIFLKRNLCKREFSAYLNAMKNSFKKVNKSSNKKGKHTNHKKKPDYKEIGHKKIKLDMEMTEGDYGSEDGIDIVKISRKKEPPEKGQNDGQKWMGKATEKRKYSNKDKTDRSAKNNSNKVSKKSGSGYESEDGIDIVKIWRKKEPPEKGQNDGQKWMGKATEKRKYSNKDKTDRSAKKSNTVSKKSGSGYESEDGIDIVKIWRKKEPPEKGQSDGQKWMGKATEKRKYSSKDKTDRSAKNNSNKVSKKSGSGYESEDGIDIVKIWRKKEPPEKGQSDGKKWMGKATEKRKYSSKDKTDRSAKNKSKKVLKTSRILSVSQEKVSKKFSVKSTAVDDITVGTTLAPKSVAVCLPRKKVAKSEKVLEAFCAMR